MKNNLAIITVVYENYEVLNDFLNSIKQQKTRNFKVFIIDGSIHRKEIETQNLPIHIIEIRNKGYADGVNHGLHQAQKEGYTNYCVMNYDTYFNANFTEALENSFKEHPGSIFGGKIYYAPGYEYHKERYSKDDLGKVIWFAGGEIDWKHAQTPHIGVNQVDNGQFNDEIKVSFITGCLMCFDQDVLKKVGFWNSSYFLYYEDSDYCVRAARKNIDLFYIPMIELWHKNGQITEGPGSKFHQKYQDKNRLIFGLKYAPFRTKIHLLKNHLQKMLF